MRRPRGAPRPGRSPTEWAVRGVLAGLAAVLGAVSVSATVANVIVKVDAARAHRLSPFDGIITASLAQQQFAVEPQSAPGSPSARLARLALRQDATAVEALTVLGLQAQLRDQTEQARPLFAYSLRLSRRELQPRVWAIEEAVVRGDIADALRSYDIALRTSSDAPNLLFPVLASAIAQPKVREGLVRIMATKPAWASDFVHYASLNAPDPRALEQFFGEASKVGMPVEETDRTALVNGLLASRFFDDAWNYYASFRPNAVRSRSRDPHFSRSGDGAAAFDWSTPEQHQVFSSIVKGRNGGAVEFSAPASLGGVVLMQTQMLPPGTYLLQGHSREIAQPAASQPYWVLSCREGPELGRVNVPNSAQNGGLFQGSFTVPSGCPVQTLSLVLRSSDEIAGVAGQIDRAELVAK